MNTQLNQVRNFMMIVGQNVRHQPADNIPINERSLRIRLIQEELSELAESIGQIGYPDGFFGHPPQAIDKVAALDALTDIAYVLFGTYHTLGLSEVAEAAFDEVHRSNLSKLQPDGTVLRDEHGKILKPSGYFKPDLSKFIDITPVNPFNDSEI